MKSILSSLKLGIERSWYEKAWWLVFLRPFSWIYIAVVELRRSLYQTSVLKSTTFDVPVIVVGNIVVGGSAKTPFVIYLANTLTEQGYRVGIASRGYKTKAKKYPHVVNEAENPSLSGDEPYLIQQRTGCPVVIDPKRKRGIQHLIDQYKCQVVICDDGLQHLAVKPTISIALHPYKKIGESADCIPAGPLREPLTQLKFFDLTLDTTPDSDEAFRVAKSTLELLDKNGEYVDKALLNRKTITAVTGIARPQRFILSLNKIGINPTPKFYPDHYNFSQKDFLKINTPIVMTEKDWVKCKNILFNDDVYIARLNLEPCHCFRSEFNSLFEKTLKKD